jgi:hypothetical protein
MRRQHYSKCTWTRRDGRRCWAPGRYDVYGVAVCEWHVRAAQAEYARTIREAAPSWAYMPTWAEGNSHD